MANADQSTGTTSTTIGRRTLMKGAAAVAAVAATATKASANDLIGNRDPHVWLASRASFGVTEALISDVKTRGFEPWVDRQLDPATIDDSALDARLATFDWIGWTADQMLQHPSLESWEIAHEARAVRLLRATFSERQLFERIVEFWTDHFNVYGSADGVSILKVVDDADVIRTHALGRFRDLLHASAKSPAMVEYLDNDTNVVGAAQENYAREVMELHTLGSTGGYTEADVREVARCFTGWNYWKSWQTGGTYGTFNFRAQDHDYDAKVFLGQTIPAGGGVSDAEYVLDVLADHPSTILFVTTKLARWLLGYEPPQRVIDAARSTWAATGGDIREIVRTLLSTGAFRASTPWDAPKIKRPFHWVVSLYRATGIDLPDPTATIWQNWSLGHTPYQWHAPNGFPDAAEKWAARLLPRWQQAAIFGQGWYWSTAHTSADLRALLGGAPMARWSLRLSELMTGGMMSLDDIRRIQGHVNTFSSPSDRAVGEAFELAASCPSFQKY